MHGSRRLAKKKKRGRPESIHHMSGCEVDRTEGEKGRYVDTKLESVFFLLSRQVVSITLTSGVQNCNRALEWMIQCVVLGVGPLPPYVHLVST